MQKQKYPVKLKELKHGPQSNYHTQAYTVHRDITAHRRTGRIIINHLTLGCLPTRASLVHAHKYTDESTPSSAIQRGDPYLITSVAALPSLIIADLGSQRQGLLLWCYDAQPTVNGVSKADRASASARYIHTIHKLAGNSSRSAVFIHGVIQTIHLIMSS